MQPFSFPFAFRLAWIASNQLREGTERKEIPFALIWGDMTLDYSADFWKEALDLFIKAVAVVYSTQQFFFYILNGSHQLWKKI